MNTETVPANKGTAMPPMKRTDAFEIARRVEFESRIRVVSDNALESAYRVLNDYVRTTGSDKAADAAKVIRAEMVVRSILDK